MLSVPKAFFINRLSFRSCQVISHYKEHIMKPAMNGDQYLTELNKRLHDHPAYKDGMAFEAYPPGTSGSDIESVSWTQFFDAPGIYAEIRNKLDEEVDVVWKK